MNTILVKYETESWDYREIGTIAADEWQKTAEIRKNIELDTWVVMPNHFHGILIVNNDDDISRGDVSRRRDVLAKRLYEYNGSHPKMSEISPIKNSISTAIRFFKRQTTIRSQTINSDFTWQPRFYDRVIRDESELNRIRAYIQQNPQNWADDENNL